MTSKKYGEFSKFCLFVAINKTLESFFYRFLQLNKSPLLTAVHPSTFVINGLSVCGISTSLLAGAIWFSSSNNQHKLDHHLSSLDQFLSCWIKLHTIVQQTINYFAIAINHAVNCVASGG